MADPALDQLVTTLIRRTQAGEGGWQEATGDGNSFVAHSPHGTVTIQRYAGVRGAVTGGFHLVARDSSGKVIAAIQSPTLSSVIEGRRSSAADRLDELFDLIKERHTGDHTALQRLIADFGG